MSMFWIGDPYFPYRYLGRMIWYVWSTSYSWTQNCTQFFPFWIFVANLSSTSASCLSSLLMGRVLLWMPWLHWGLGLQFFLCKYEICLPFRNNSHLKGKFWTIDPNPIPKSFVDLLHIPIYFWREFNPQFHTPPFSILFWGLLWLIFHPCTHQIHIMWCENSSTFEAKCGP